MLFGLWLCLPYLKLAFRSTVSIHCLLVLADAGCELSLEVLNLRLPSSRLGLGARFGFTGLCLQSERANELRPHALSTCRCSSSHRQARPPIAILSPSADTSGVTARLWHNDGLTVIVAIFVFMMLRACSYSADWSASFA